MNVGNSDLPLIVLTTDFGLSDAYVGVMKGVILGINPQAVIVDLTHDIQPQDVHQGSLVLGQNYPYFPTGSIHVAVVDPGVGTDRRAVLLETAEATFIAPDNGLLSEVLKKQPGISSPEPGNTGTISLPSHLKAYDLTNPRFRRQPVSNTFHGRDVFAPAAAYLSLAVPPAEMGSPVTQLVYLPLREPTVHLRDVRGEVIYIDKFGNLVTNISADHLGAAGLRGPTMSTVIGNRRIVGLSRTFHDVKASVPLRPGDLPLVALIGSNGYLEIALSDGNAAHTLGLGIGEPVAVSFGA